MPAHVQGGRGWLWPSPMVAISWATAMLSPLVGANDISRVPCAAAEGHVPVCRTGVHVAWGHTCVCREAISSLEKGGSTALCTYRTAWAVRMLVTVMYIGRALRRDLFLLRLEARACLPLVRRSHQVCRRACA